MRDKIKQLVEDYISKNPKDYLLVCEYIENKRKTLKDQKFGQGESGYSALTEIPAELHEIFQKELTAEERQEFSKLEHAKWFANTFPQFRLPDEV